MDYTVSDFYHVFEEKFVLIAGKGGLSRNVNSVGILDYELDPSVRDRYVCDNFHEGMIVVSTFLYAKKNPYLIGDAVRHLIRKGCSALLIRNVFNLQIPETVLKYADSKDFPILQVNGSGVYFEDFVYEVRHRREQMEHADFYNDALNELLSGELSPEEIVHRTKVIVPSLGPSYFVACAIPDEPLGEEESMRLLEKYRQSNLFSVTNKLIQFSGQVLFAVSSDTLSQSYGKRLFSDIAGMLSGGRRRIVQLGISALHYYRMEFRDAILESRYAARCRRSGQEPFICYEEIGVYKLLMPFCHTKEFSRFSDRILDPIRDHDTENGTVLFETLLCYVKNGANLKQTAQELSQHENTIRYRLEKIGTVCDLNYRSSEDAEQLSLAVKIYIARTLLPEEN